MRGERGEQVERLENHSQFFAPQAGTPVIVQSGELHAFELDRSGGRLIQAANQIQQRGLPGAGRSHDRDPLALFDG